MARHGDPVGAWTIGTKSNDLCPLRLRAQDVNCVVNIHDFTHSRSFICLNIGVVIYDFGYQVVNIVGNWHECKADL